MAITDGLPNGVAHTVSVDPHTGAAVVLIPLKVADGRGGFAPQLSLSHTASSGNSVVGLGWTLGGLSSIVLDTQAGAPRYMGADPIAHSSVGRLVPELEGGRRRAHLHSQHRVEIYRSRIGSGGARFERWQSNATGDVHWKSRAPDGTVTVYGRSPHNRIADPADPQRVFRWLVESIHAADGNAISIEYRSEDDAGVDPRSFEATRGARHAQRYPKRLCYGNATPIGPDDSPSAAALWHFEVVLDYGDHDEEAPQAQADRPWRLRGDAFVSGRSGFEVRTRRRLERVLVFHRFQGLPRSTVCVGVSRLDYADHPAGARLERVEYQGRRQVGGEVVTRSLPPLTLAYSAASVGDGFRSLAAEGAVVPGGLLGPRRWVDLLGEGLPGVLTMTHGGWYFRRNLGGGRFGPDTPVERAPAALAGGFVLSDFDGDGNPELARFVGSGAGYYAYDRDAERWQSFVPFESAPRLPVDAPVQWVDLDGDGLSDLVVAHPDHFTWYRSMGRRGFHAPVEVPIPTSSGGGPPLVTRDASRHFFFADMTGDGRPALVRVDQGRVEYWPHLGHGRFGAGVLMEDAPRFDHVGTFDPRRIRFSDLDGTGTADLIYVGRGEVRCWTNASGNRFVDERRRAAPYIDDIAEVRIIDLLGDGTPCMVWSSALPGDVRDPLRYLPLTDGVRPGLLLGVDNGMGRETRLTHGRSSTHYLRDEAEGRPWLSRLHSHVGVVDRIEVFDHIAGNRAVTRFAYHDGAFDGRERQFRGFGCVDRYDADTRPGEAQRPAAFSAPTCARTWYHDGTPRRAATRRAMVWAGDPAEYRLAPSGLEASSAVPTDEYEDAYRALAGLALREEIYATSDGVLQSHPLRVGQSRYLVRRLQPAADGAPARFAAHRVERLDADYGSTTDDPRVAHHLALEIDGRGTIRTEAHVAYPRRGVGPPEAAAQARLYAEATRTTVLHVDEPTRYRSALHIESEDFTLLALTPQGGLVARERLLAELPAALAAPLERHPPVDGAGLRARRRAWSRVFFWSDDRAGALPLGEVGRLPLVHHEESACFTDPWVAEVYGDRVDAALLTGLGYRAADGCWWQPGPTHRYRGPDAFYTPEARVAPDGGETRYTFDAAWLVHTEVRDPVGNVTAFETDYQALATRRTTDANGTITEVRYDPLGVPVLSASRGAALDDAGGQRPYGSPPLTDHVLPAAPSFEAVIADPSRGLGPAARYVFYDLHAWSRDRAPPRSVVVSREALVHDGQGGGVAEGPVDVVVEYADGFGRVVQRRQRVEAGPAIVRGVGGAIELDAEGQPRHAPAEVRWQVSGHTVHDNKQRVVETYAPWFSARADYEGDAVLRRLGSATRHRYDALGRQVETTFPDGTVARSEHTPWLERRYDANDAVAGSAWQSERAALPTSDPERRALTGALAHADTPTTVHFDPLGRAVVTVEHGVDETLTTIERYDDDGALAEIVDPRGVVAFSYRHDMLGRAAYTHSADAGESRVLFDPADAPVHTWDALGLRFTTDYDLAGRPIAARVEGGVDPPRVLERWTYGESLAADDARARNARGRLVERRDGAGLYTVDVYAPGGEPLRHTMRLAADYREAPDWSDPAAVALTDEVFETRARYDALGRPRWQRSADGAEQATTYQRGGALAAIRLTTAGGELVDAPIIDGAVYDAHGLRTRAVLGNGVQLDVDYDPDSHRMQRLRARRTTPAGTRLYQDIRYAYDPVGNVVWLADAAQQPERAAPGVIQGLGVTADCAYTYDAFYRLVEATGRVHQALTQHDYRREADVARPGALRGTAHLSLDNGAAVERYTRTYTYDAAGNLTRKVHRGASQTFAWDYWVSPTSNRRLPATTLAGLPTARPEERFDDAGRCVELPHVRALRWSSRGRLDRAVIIDRSVDGRPDDAEYYTYDADGRRRRKVTETLSNEGIVEVIDKIYLDGCEIKRVRRGAAPVLERHTTHVDDGVGPVARVHRWLRDDRAREVDAPSVRAHYLLRNHLGSTALELDAAGDVITYEEYFPYGGSAFLAGASARDVRIRDYRYSGKERDDATGLYYYGYRYYAPFIGNWLSPDPLGPIDGLNLYRFVRNNPLSLVDPNGLDSTGWVRRTGVDPDASEAEAIRQANWGHAFHRGYRITDLTPSADGKNWLITGERPLTAAEHARYGPVLASLDPNDPRDQQVAQLFGALYEALEPLEAPIEGLTTNAPDAEDGGGSASAEPGDDPPPSSPGEGTSGGDDEPTPGDGTPPPAAGDGRDPTSAGGGRESDDEGGRESDPRRGEADNGPGGGRRRGAGDGRRPSTGAGAAEGSPLGSPNGTPGGAADGAAGGVPGGTGDADQAPRDPEPRRGHREGALGGRPERPPNDYRPPPPGTLPGGADPLGSPTGHPEGAAGEPTGAEGEQVGAPGGDASAGGAGSPPPRERDALDTLVDIASYVTLDAVFSEDSADGDANGVPGGMGLFDLDLGRWGQVAYVGVALVDLVMTVVSLGGLKAMMTGAKAALKTALSQARRLIPRARQALSAAAKRVAALLTRRRPSTAGVMDEAVTFFHGTNRRGGNQIRAQGIDLTRSRYNTDFGRGFYLSESRSTAESAARRLYGNDIDVIEFSIPRTQIERMHGLHFSDVTADWADFVRFHRSHSPRILMHGGRAFDMVSGPMFRRMGRHGEVRAWPNLHQLSIHTDLAVEVFNRGMIRP